LIALAIIWLTGPAAKCASTNSAEAFDYAQPPLLTGTIYASGSDHKTILFTFQRTATRSGVTVHIERKYMEPDGSLAATENITYESGRLVSLEMKEFQAGLWGSIQIKVDPKKPARQKITISHGAGKDANKAGTTDDLDKDTLIDDSIYPFILAHWNELMKGDSVKFRFVSLEWERTFGFKLSKSGESVVDGKPVVTIRMDPTSMVVAHFMDPLYFTVEKNAPHRVVEYLGRTTPRTKNGKAWKYLDADTVFDWK